MAEASSTDPNAGLQNSETEATKDFAPSFCSKKEGSRTMKRTRDVAEQSGDATEESEPEEKRPSFRLNPPTLIHGQAKPAPKEEEEITESSSKRNFLRPSILSAPATTSVIPPATSTPVNGKSVSTISQPPLLGSGLLLSGQVPSNNPFLKTVDPEGNQEAEPEERKDFLFQSTIEQRIKENGDVADPSSSNAASGSTFESVNGAKENVFLQMSKGNDKEDDKSASAGSSGFIFGSKMEERVVKNEADSTSDNADDSGKGSQEFLFGKNLSDRVKTTGPDSTNTLFSTVAAESRIFTDSLNSSSDGVSSSTCHRKLEEEAAALFAASNAKPVIPEVEVVTGEEDEKNVLQIQCKLFQYNSSTQSWTERGRGNLRLNDKRVSPCDQVFQSRLVMRTHGSLRLVLNTKVWAAMIVEKASQKSVRISAQNEDGDIGIYLITATINDAEQIYRALEYRVLHLKQIDEQQKDHEKSTEPSSSQEGEKEDSSPSDQPGSNERNDSPKKPEPDSSANAQTTEAKEEESEATITSSKPDDENPSGDDTSGAGEPRDRSQVEETRPAQPTLKSDPDSTASNTPATQTDDNN